MSLPSRERGLKSFCSRYFHTCDNVAPLAGAWIEMTEVMTGMVKKPVAPLAGAWIEMFSITESLSSRFGRSPRGSVD